MLLRQPGTQLLVLRLRRHQPVGVVLLQQLQTHLVGGAGLGQARRVLRLGSLRARGRVWGFDWVDWGTFKGAKVGRARVEGVGVERVWVERVRVQDSWLGFRNCKALSRRPHLPTVPSPSSP